jgi:hypothetical protein
VGVCGILNKVQIKLLPAREIEMNVKILNTWQDLITGKQLESSITRS